MEQMLDVLDKIVTEVPMYKLYCNMDPEAAVVSYTEMSK
jgi:hypothetical protein